MCDLPWYRFATLWPVPGCFPPKTSVPLVWVFSFFFSLFCCARNQSRALFVLWSALSLTYLPVLWALTLFSVWGLWGMGNISYSLLLEAPWASLWGWRHGMYNRALQHPPCLPVPFMCSGTWIVQFWLVAAVSSSMPQGQSPCLSVVYGCRLELTIPSLCPMLSYNIDNTNLALAKSGSLLAEIAT